MSICLKEPQRQLYKRRAWIARIGWGPKGRKDTWDLCDMINQEKDPIVTKKIAKELLKALKKEAIKKAQRNSYYWETCEDSNRNYFDAIEELKEEIIGSTKTRI